MTRTATRLPVRVWTLTTSRPKISWSSAAEFLEEGADAESWSDDPVRMYLTQMGEIPLLTRKEEISLAKRIENTRQRFRASCWNATTLFSLPTRC